MTVEHFQVVWPSGLRRWIKAPVSQEAWVQIPPLPIVGVEYQAVNYFDGLVAERKAFATKDTELDLS